MIVSFWDGLFSELLLLVSGRVVDMIDSRAEIKVN